MARAVAAVKNGMPVKTAARNFAVPRMSLKRRTQAKNIHNDNKKIFGCFRQVFSAEQEKEVVNHLLQLQARMYGLTTKDAPVPWLISLPKKITLIILSIKIHSWLEKTG